jgi:hypothetical protein
MYAGQFEAVDDALGLFEEMAARQESRGMGSDRKLRALRHVIGAILAKSVKTLEAIELLCDHGWTADGLALLRTLFENAANAMFLCTYKTWGTYLYLEGRIRTLEKMAEEGADDAMRARSLKQTLQEREALKAGYGGPPRTQPLLWRKPGSRRRWEHWTLRDRCERVGLMSLYRTLYRWTSYQTHGSVESLGLHSRQGVGAIEFPAEPTDEGLAGCLAAAVVCFLQVLLRFDDAFKSGNKERIRKATRGASRLLKMPGSQPSA